MAAEKTNDFIIKLPSAFMRVTVLAMGNGQTYEQLKRVAQALQSRGSRAGLTPAERADWAYGNAVIENADVTREMATRAVATLGLPDDK